MFLNEYFINREKTLTQDRLFCVCANFVVIFRGKSNFGPRLFG